MSEAGSILGNAVLRKEDPELVTGNRDYFSDMAGSDAAHIVFIRSTIAHAEIVELDITDALTMPGVLAVHSTDTLSIDPEIPVPVVAPELARNHLADRRVRFVGDIVAAVVAETEAQAVDAAEMVFVDYEPLPVVTDVESAVADGAELIWPEIGTNVVFTTSINFEDDVLAGADTIVKARVVSQRLAAAPIEPIGCLARPVDDRIEMWIPSQNPVAIHELMASKIGLPPAKVRVVAPAVGGGFGAKGGYYVEYGITGRVAKDLHRPVKWTSTRSEDMLTLNQGRGHVVNIELGIDTKGNCVGLRADGLADTGAYSGTAAFLTTFTQLMTQGPYDIGAVAYRGRSVCTNTTRIAAYRGAGRPEATQALERVMDLGARAAGMDPAEFRRQNLLAPEQFPLVTATGANYDVGEYRKTLDMALKESGYDGLRAEQKSRRDRGDSRLLGIGVSCYVEVTAPLGIHSEWGRVEIDPNGGATMSVGTSSHGQGHDTSFSMLVSEVLGIPIDQITLHQSDTDTVARGIGTFGSRSLQIGGSALHEASQVVLDKAKTLAAHLLEASADDIVTAEGGLQVAGVPTAKLSWSDLVMASNDDGRRPVDMEPGLDHELVFEAKGSSFPFGSHVSVVEVDTDTGEVSVLRHVAVDDCGRILNPMLVRGQQHGGIAQGMSQALFEAVSYDEDANPTSATFMDYLVPAASELPSFDCHNTQTPSPRNPLGAKGIGESGTIGSTPAVQSAVIDALSHFGVTHIDMPMAPEKIWRAINSSSSGS